MGKKKKTREQKIASATRHHLYIPAYSLPTTLSSTQPISHDQAHVTPYAVHHETSYIVNDLQKTLYVSTLLVCIEIILYFLLHQHIMKIPGY